MAAYTSSVVGFFRSFFRLSGRGRGCRGERPGVGVQARAGLADGEGFVLIEPGCWATTAADSYRRTRLPVW